MQEFVEGKSLKNLLSTWGRFPGDQVLDLGIQMASALAHAHDQGRPPRRQAGQHPRRRAGPRS
ncbi:MAG: hypothetical protein R3F30_10665 [Planctomycetota bacterium]